MSVLPEPFWWDREDQQPRPGSLGARPDYDAWAGDVTGKLDDRADALVIFDGLGPDEFDGWTPRTSASARLMALGVGLAVGVALAFWVAPIVARFLS